MTESPSTSPLVLPEVLQLQDLVDLRGQLLERRGSDVTVDGAAVNRASTLGLQFLLSAVATWAADGKIFHLRSPSPALAEAIGLLGIGPSQLPREAPES